MTKSWKDNMIFYPNSDNNNGIIVNPKYNIDCLYNMEYQKLILNLSTEMGCSMNCSFCECWRNGANGIVSLANLRNQLESLLQVFINKYPIIGSIKRIKIYFARCGEPTLNENIFTFVEDYMEDTIKRYISTEEIFPLVSTIFPITQSAESERFLIRWAYYKKYKMNGKAGLQFSINSSDDAQRNKLFGGKVQGLKTLSSWAYHNLPMPNPERKYTLSFAVDMETILDPEKITMLFDQNMFAIKLTPMHDTWNLHNLSDKGFTLDLGHKLCINYAEEFDKLGWKNIYIIEPTRFDLEDGITSGNKLID